MQDIFLICPFLLWLFFLNVFVTNFSTLRKEIIIIRSRRCTVQCKIYYIEIFFCKNPYSLVNTEINILNSRLRYSRYHIILFKGTQEWEFFWLRFWILYYFIVIYVKILRFCKKKLFDLASIGEGTIFPRSPRTTRNEKNFWARSKKYF